MEEYDDMTRDQLIAEINRLKTYYRYVIKSLRIRIEKLQKLQEDG